jgi:hypothetical protein
LRLHPRLRGEATQSLDNGARDGIGRLTALLPELVLAAEVLVNLGLVGKVVRDRAVDFFKRERRGASR